MQIFKITKEILTPITEKEFSLEKDIQKIVENNLNVVFGL